MLVTSHPGCARRTVSYIDRILKGENVGNLPIQFATKCHRVIDLMSFVQLFSKRPAGAVDHSPALDGHDASDFETKTQDKIDGRGQPHRNL